MIIARLSPCPPASRDRAIPSRGEYSPGKEEIENLVLAVMSYSWCFEHDIRTTKLTVQDFRSPVIKREDISQSVSVVPLEAYPESPAFGMVMDPKVQANRV